MSSEAALNKMRLMALLVLGSRSAGAAVSFADIQAALDITTDQVRASWGAACVSMCVCVSVCLRVSS